MGYTAPTFVDSTDPLTPPPGGGVPLDASHMNALAQAVQGAAVIADAGNAGTATGNALKTALLPKWKPSTGYASGEFVLNPSGQIVQANSAFTSGTTYDATKWTVVAGGGGGGSGTQVTVDGSPVSTLAISSADPTAWAGYAATILYPQTASGTLTSGRQWICRVTRGKKAGATKIGFILGTSSSGTVMVGVYRPSGTGTTTVPGTLAASSGAPQSLTTLFGSATGYLEVPLTTSVDVAEGDYLSLWVSDGVMAFAYGGAATAISGMSSMSVYSDTIGTGGTAMVSNPTGQNAHTRMLYLTAA